ncbi:efflux RND transporter permease subunit [Mesorhizobium sp. M4B.F.Ca.ET.215.01.1.1]|uniref:efflux RND transporter permease subunit n=2 Tax=Mesorhizobium TaxID=68287 RepID=UPI000FCC9308|nr:MULTISPECIES: efflux RND transporter permease subunit [unclassified Mesorhizobium]RUW28073.1 efflux RND transporter permease subunit [Mesorhizobium sp. M4B.F.Ca.ET.013.02.1.1]RUW71482.1 efflux RND transporter permease subunit [Mesorhizobium sp. M4B.F.Ca.ET.049.02.1.2]RWC98288.1 MAG: efflux RND transporter permease subunit [Mesorhizobium sp.]RWF67736.1 MAG: efflux RND transporter permease subunit [Mesorhizobium sp.]TGQ18429.1 efflux RND transporter permease subunit [Mesorhizobium sp. M4B.F.C
MKLGIAGWLTRSFIASPLTPLFLLAALALGLVALVTLPREEEPQISVPMVDIHVSANGLRAEDAAKLVTEPLETIIKGIDGVEHVYSQTTDDGALVTARFKVGTSSDAAILRIHEKVHANMDRIPVGIPEPLIVGRGIDDVAIVVVTLTPAPQVAARYSSADLTRLAHELQVEVAKLPDIGLTYVVGEQPDEIQVEPDPEKLSLYGITLQQLMGKIAGANRSFQIGTVRDRGNQRVLVAGQTLQALSEIGNLLLTARDGRPVYIRDVASVVLATSPAENRVTNITKSDTGLERAPAVSVAIAKRPGTNAVVIADMIVKRLEQVRGQIFPNDVEMRVTRNYGETANEKANELLFHLGLATVSIVLLIAVAIGWREALVVAVVIPTTILLTMFASRVMGYTLNRVSLFALIFSIGILVDDAIVVIENIARHWAMDGGRSRAQAAIDAVAEVGNPTIVATLTVVAALLPMLFVSGLMGPYMSPIPANASAAMLFSFFVAVMLTPWLMMKLGGKDRVGAHGHAGSAQGGVLGRIYIAVARPILKSRLRAWAFLLVVGIATIASMALIYTEHVTVKLLPFDNKTELQIVADLPKGSSVEDTDRLLQAAANRLASVPEVVSFQTYAGASAPFNFNGLVRHYYLRSSPEQGDIAVNLLPKGDRSRASHAIALDLRERLMGMAMPAGTVLKVVEPPPGPPVLGTLLAEIYGPDAETRRAVAAKVRETFASIPFIVDVDDSFHNQPERLRLSIDQDNLEYYKVEQADVYDTLSYLYGGTTVGYSHRGGGRLPIPIRIALSKANGVVDQRALATPVAANALPGARDVVELGDVVRVSQEPASYPIFRHNGRPAEMVMGELAGAFEAPVYGMLAVDDAIAKADWGALPKPQIALHGQPDDESKPTLLWDGEWEVTWVTFRDMGAAFMVAILGIYILVVAQFGSFRLPLVILTPIPLTLIGIMLGHWAFVAPFTATSMIGFIALAGIIVRNSILLVDFIRHARSEDRPLLEVLLEAGAIRFKPILLTALAAMIGAAVILTDPIFQGLAISLLFGLASSTLLTVLVIPAIYVALRGGPRADAGPSEPVAAALTEYPEPANH